MNFRLSLLGTTVGRIRRAFDHTAQTSTVANDVDPVALDKIRQEFARSARVLAEKIVVPVRVEMSEEAYLRIVARIPIGVRTKYAEATDFLGLELRKVSGLEIAEVVYSDGSRRPLDREEDGF